MNAAVACPLPICLLQSCMANMSHLSLTKRNKFLSVALEKDKSPENNFQTLWERLYRSPGLITSAEVGRFGNSNFISSHWAAYQHSVGRSLEPSRRQGLRKDNAAVGA